VCNGNPARKLDQASGGSLLRQAHGRRLARTRARLAMAAALGPRGVGARLLAGERAAGACLAAAPAKERSSWPPPAQAMGAKRSMFPERARRRKRARAEAGAGADAASVAALKDWRRSQGGAGRAAPTWFLPRPPCGLAASRPGHPSALAGSAGFGSAKLERYGEAVLAVLAPAGERCRAPGPAFASTPWVRAMTPRLPAGPLSNARRFLRKARWIWPATPIAVCERRRQPRRSERNAEAGFSKAGSKVAGGEQPGRWRPCRPTACWRA